ncbi:MAG TPA: hypothetical protein VGQ06_14035 [Gemmatimonadales bacterium]|nr:hypothetical protein [Gemmatimonadales bacterium]
MNELLPTGRPSTLIVPIELAVAVAKIIDEHIEVAKGDRLSLAFLEVSDEQVACWVKWILDTYA